MKPRMSAGWGNAVENSGLPRGKVGVTPWKSRGNPVEIGVSAVAVVSKFLAYVLHSAIVSNELCASNPAEKGVSFRAQIGQSYVDHFQVLVLEVPVL